MTQHWIENLPDYPTPEPLTNSNDPKLVANCTDDQLVVLVNLLDDRPTRLTWPEKSGDDLVMVRFLRPSWIEDVELIGEEIIIERTGIYNAKVEAVECDGVEV